MKLFTAALVGASLLGSVAASAQSIELNVGPDRDRAYRSDRYDRDRNFRDSRAYYRHRDRGETVIIKKKRVIRQPGVVIRSY